MGRCRLAVGAVSLLMVGISQLVPAGTASAVTPSRVSANTVTCQQWNITGNWTINQSNNYHPIFVFKQTGTEITGTSTLTPAEQAQGNYTSPVSTLEGTLYGDKLDIIVTNPPKYTGVVVKGEFKGIVMAGSSAGKGTVDNGTAQDISTPGERPVSWSGFGPAVCSSAGWKWSVTFENANNFWAGHGEGTSCRPEGRACVANTPGYEGSIVDEECTISICSPCPVKPCKVTIPIVPSISAEVTNSTLQVLPLTVSRPYVAWRTPPKERILRLTIKVTSSSRSNLCPIGDVGEAILVDRDMVNSITGVHASSFEVGGWARPCLDQSFDLNGLVAAAHSPTGPALIPGQYATVVEVACYDPDTGSWNPAACGG
jgi:hypothetical protein